MKVGNREILHMCICYIAKADHQAAATNYYEAHHPAQCVQCMSIVPTGVQEYLPDCQPSPMTDSGLSSSSTSSSISLGVGGTALSHVSPILLSEVNVSAEQDEKVKALIEFITSR